jgi:hypothetical protein
MRDRHHEILLLGVQPYLTPRCSVDEDRANDRQHEKHQTFTQVLCIVPVTFFRDGPEHQGVEGIIPSNKIFLEHIHVAILLPEFYEPPGECGDEVAQQKPVDKGDDGKSFFLF